MLSSYFFKLFLFFISVYKNTNNIILLLSKNCSYFVNLVFSMIFIFFKTKKKLNTLFMFFIYFLFFITKKHAVTNVTQVFFSELLSKNQTQLRGKKK